MTSMPPMKLEAPDQAEEAGRAELYGLLATLFYAPPTQTLLDAIAGTQTHCDSVLERAWAVLVDACGQARAEPVREEYERLFIGVGKPEVMLYGSYYLSGFLMEKPLAALRADLAELGLERGESVPESEDHIATLCDVMRFLITSDEAVHREIAAQEKFFVAHMQAWVAELCAALQAHPQAKFYAAVAHLAAAFFDVEMQAFDMA
jgi:TorA maturation chaperone TorD